MEDNKLSTVHVNDIKSMIYEVRGKQIMLDSDLAILFNCIGGTKVINQAVKRNIGKFPEEFCFRLTNEDYDDLLRANLRSQVGTSSLKNNYGGRRHLPHAFSEYGIIMLSSVLKSDVAVRMSVNVVKAFVEMRKIISSNIQIFEKIITMENTINNKFWFMMKSLMKYLII